ncbi:MAG: UDP-3-O-(3-hydroxymyristoyl)glucosamine N-acyltransferase [Alphaproteobacteria bacterium]|nr:UDP-3-O-(3-hydroxymyristoyl)glucosamine N-acyltransferase [Alphaproteobacteria bacterium]
MPDARFFHRAGPFSLNALASLSGARLARGEGKSQLTDVAPLHQASKADLTFLDNARYRAQLPDSRAGACFLSEEMVDYAPPDMALLVTKTPYKAYALAAQAFYPHEITPPPAISPHAFIDPSAEIGEGCVIEAGAVIGPQAVIGARCRIGANATISHALIGDAVRIYPGVRIGQDGFGFAIDPAGHVKVPQLGRVVIGDHVEIGANSCIDRGAGPDTVIGPGTWIDNLVQIGHNVQIGRGCVIVAQAGVAGSTVLEDYAVLAAQAGVAGHLRVGQGARIGAQSGVMRDVPAGSEMLGSPAVPVKEFMRQVTALARLVKRK